MKYNPSHHRTGKIQTAPIRRGLQHIQTMTELITDSSNPQHKFMKLAILSMENQRKTKELSIAEQLIQELKLRLAQIEIETAALLSHFESLKETPPEVFQPSPTRAAASAQVNSSGFKLKY
ncbi:MAG: hypothetical protein WCJ40_03250 [Planctomycetota bacterium]|nr:hypothetical protein [Planctomycetota bacterium]